MQRKIKSLLALPFLILTAGCAVQKAAGSTEAGAGARFPEVEMKESLQRGAASNAVPLKLQRAVSNGRGAEFAVPAGIAYSDSGDLYVSDNNAHAVHLWQSRAAASGELSAGAEAGRLKFPGQVRVRGEELFVADTDGIKVLSSDGRFEHLLRPYYAIQDFAVTDKGTIVASVLVRSANAQDPLLIEIDQTGRVVRGIGARRPTSGRDDYENQVFVSVSGNRLVAAYKYSPLVEVYELDSGKLVRSFEVSHPVFEALKSLPAPVADASMGAAGQKLEPRYFAGVKAMGDRIFLCLYLPTPEVWEMNEEGGTLAAFRADGLPTAVNIFGFDARSGGGELKFAIGVIDRTWGASISELSATYK